MNEVSISVIRFFFRKDNTYHLNMQYYFFMLVTLPSAGAGGDKGDLFKQLPEYAAILITCRHIAQFVQMLYRIQPLVGSCF